MEKKKSGFSSSIGFILAAAGSAVGIGNIWRFPYLAAKDGGGLFLIIYLALVFTFGFTLLTTDIAIGRKTKLNALYSFKSISPKWEFLGKLTFLVPLLIMTYYSVIGGWITKYLFDYTVTDGNKVAENNYFTSFITSRVSPFVFMLIFLLFTVVIVYMGIEKGIEKFSKFVMPILVVLVVVIGIYSLTLSHTDKNGVTRTGMQGLLVYLTPDVRGLTFGKFLSILLDAMSQLFFSLSVSMGIMITYGSYVDKDTNLEKSISQIEFFDTGVALLAGLMIIPSVYVFFGKEGMSSGSSLMFISLPKVFKDMGPMGKYVGLMFFLMVVFAALTSCISIMETLVANFVEILKAERHKVCLGVAIYSVITSTIVCMGYNVLYFELKLPNGSVGQILDVVDYISTSFSMPLISFLTCVFIAYVTKPSWITEEMELNGYTFHKKHIYSFIIKYVAPIMLGVLFLVSTGFLKI